MGKVLITGTGRAGTSFLVHLLSALGLDTGYTEDECFNICNNACQAGAEHTIEKPYKILKNPQFMMDMEEIVKEHDIEHVIIPIRRLEDTAKSRENNNENHGGFGGYTFDAENYDEQLEYNAHYFYKMIEVLTKNEIPFTTIAFPLMIEDWRYLLDRLEEALFDSDNLYNSKSPTASFKEAHKRIANPDKITIK